MKRAACILFSIGLLALLPGCKKQENDTEAIRSGINQHLASLKTLNLDAMDMNILSVSIQGDQAHAQVEFRPKTGAQQGPGMQVAYTLAKQDGVWVVQTTQPTGGMIPHPGPEENPHMDSTAPSPSTLPNFRDLVPGGSSTDALPPGHPPVSTQKNAPGQ